MTARREHRRALKDFLERDAVMNLFALSWLENYGVVATRPGSFHFRLAFGERGQIDAAALVKMEKLTKQKQFRMNKFGKATESDRRIAIKKPKHLFTGKRGNGKTDRR